MKSLLGFFFVTLMAATSLAGHFDDMFGSGRDRGGRGGWGGPNVTCSATDKGWEEHWGGHSDCHSCLKKHGSCTETCSANYYATKAEGVDYRGYKMTIESRGDTRYEAEREALRACNRRYSECKIVSSTSQSETVSRRSCR
ncbi:hypothetical protein [Bdellovibrio sp. KM01]|uniref:hypothetical protein n=1 Tax=Bdellovibrio sp. KM01 TaxID=2748865 RepID=UPI002107EABA|nr:hypothetical protein [Bdellovibrio sp. KM01]